MKKYIVLSVNDNPQYLFYLPLTVWAWKFFGWEPVVFLQGLNSQPPLFELVRKYIDDGLIPYGSKLEVDGYKSETIAQVSRLYGACVVYSDSYLMTGDIDMLPLSNYWRPDETKITVWGHDLTSYQHMPICYIGMTAQRWIEVMGITSNDYNALIKRDLDSMPNAKSHDSVKRWVVDQDLITERINACTFEKDFIHRGTYQNGYPIGRVDRSAWTLKHDRFIDCHMLRDIYSKPDNLQRTWDLLHHVWPNESFDWFLDYTEEFRKILLSQK